MKALSTLFAPGSLLHLVLSLLFFVTPFANARLASLYSSSVTYCSPPESLLIQEFHVQYFQHNSSIVFDITASSLLPDLNVTAKIGLNAYGLKPIDLTFNLCEVSKALCPLPLYNFSGSGTVPIPSVQGRIPGIAYLIPDLEAAAQLTLTRIENTEIVGCVQTTLSNGWSLRQRAVSWAVGGLVIFTVLISIWKTVTQSLSESSAPLSPLVYRWISLLVLCQHIVSSCFLYLNYPVAYRSFALNFAWAFGLFASSTESALQRSIENLRIKTGSDDADDGALQPIDYVNRKLSPYNIGDISNANKPARMLRRFLGDVVNGSSRLMNTPREFITPITVTSSQPDKLPAGIPLYVNSIGVSTGNAFMSMFYTVLILTGGIGILSGLIYAVIWSVDRSRKERAGTLWRIKEDYWTVVGKVVIRLALVVVIPILTLAFFQWTLDDSWLAILLSVLLVIFLGSIIGYTSFKLFKTHRKNTTSFTAPVHKLHYLTAYTEPYTPSRWFFTLYCVIPLAITKAIFTSFPKTSAVAQVAGFIIVETFFFVALLVFRPFATRGAQALEVYLSVVRLVTSGMLVAFVESVNVKPIPRAAVAFVACIIFSIAIIVLFINIVVNTILPQGWSCCRRTKEKNTSTAAVIPIEIKDVEHGSASEKRETRSSLNLPPRHFSNPGGTDGTEYSSTSTLRLNSPVKQSGSALSPRSPKSPTSPTSPSSVVSQSIYSHYDSSEGHGRSTHIRASSPFTSMPVPMVGARSSVDGTRSHSRSPSSPNTSHSRNPTSSTMQQPSFGMQQMDSTRGAPRTLYPNAEEYGAYDEVHGGMDRNGVTTGTFGPRRESRDTNYFVRK